MKQRDHIVFNPDNHTYRNVITDHYYTSITTWIGNHGHKFVASKKKTENTQKRLGLTHQEVLDLWEHKRNKSTERGSCLHNRIECFIKGEEYVWQYPLLYNDMEELNQEYGNNVLDYLFKLKRKKCILYPEQILYLDTKALAGQADLVLEYKHHLEIEDWKTNEKTIEELQNYWWETPYFKELFTELHYTDYNKYAIQLVLYGMMAEKLYGKPCKKHTINHIYQGFNQYVIDKKTVKYIKSKLKFLFI